MTEVELLCWLQFEPSHGAGRFLAVLAVAAVAGVTYVAAAPGGQTAAPTARQFAALKKQLSKLSKKVKAQGATITTLKGAVAGLPSPSCGLQAGEVPATRGLSR